MRNTFVAVIFTVLVCGILTAGIIADNNNPREQSRLENLKVRGDKTQTNPDGVRFYETCIRGQLFVVVRDYGNGIGVAGPIEECE